MGWVSIAWALASAGAYGVGDFLGGLAARRLPLLAALAFSRVVALGGIVLAASLAGPSLFTPAIWLWSAAAGLLSCVAIGLFYWCLSRGAMTVVAPITALCSIGLPVVVGLYAGESVGVVGLSGIALAAFAVVLVAQAKPAPDATAADPKSRRAILGAIGAGLGFGVYYVCLKNMSAAGGLWPLVVMRGIAAVICVGAFLILARKGLHGRPPSVFWVAGSAGLFEVVADVAYLFSVREGLLSISATITSLYPATTIVLAMVLLRERLTVIQAAGLVLAGLALVLMTQA